MIDKSFIDLFNEQVIKTPGNIAVVFENKRLSYTELNERSNQLAHLLLSKGVKEETLVPLYVERGLEMMIGMLGIMKAGGAYVPIDTDFPIERINYILNDTQAKLMVTSKILSSKVSKENEIEYIEIENLLHESKENPEAKVLPGNLVYVIYTSGSTGMPKGVMVEHRNLVDYTTGLIQKTSIGECQTFALVSTIATDLGNTVIYGSLATGGALHVFTKESVSNIEFLHLYFTKNKIDCIKIVPSHWKVLKMDGELLLPQKLIIFGGEALQEKVIEEIRESASMCRIINHYGPTETTIGKLLHIVEPEVKYEFTVPVGKPFSNTKILVLTKNLKLCPIGVPGQLYITGDGVARGYLNNPELTKEKFIRNPFSKQADSIMYNTGDLVKYLPDGNVSFIGRADNQVKIRGYRIELGEIESVLQKCPLVSQAVVLAKEDKQDDKRLVGYIIPEGPFDKANIISYLNEKLPEYMVPSLLMELESFPLTSNGKVDRNALPDPDASELLTKQYVAPRNDVEAKIAEIWQEVLEVDQVGVNDDFFELGGHSLLAVRLVSFIRKAFAVEMPIGNIFDFPTVALLAEQLSNNTDNKVMDSIEVASPRPERIPLSFSQERLWFINRLEGSIQYHVPTVLRLKGNLNTEALSFALQTIINRHEVLRSVIIEEEGNAFQHIKSADNFRLSVVEGSLYNDEKSLKEYIKKLITKPFDLSKDDMLRATLITQGTNEYILAVILHHIASDKWSKSILVTEVVELYNSFLEKRDHRLTPLKIQYTDYAIWQRNNLSGEVLDKKLDYWKNKLVNVTPLQLPTDFNRSLLLNNKGGSIEFKIEKHLSHEISSLSQKNGATIFMTLLAAFNVLLSRYSAQADICIGSPVAGRQQLELENLIGFFINTLALRSEVKGETTFRKLLQQVKATTMEAYEHQDLPFEKVVETVVKERDLSRTPLFQVMFMLQNTAEIPALNLKGLELRPEPAPTNTSKFELTFSINETEDGLQCSVEYNTGLYKASTIERMTGHYKELLGSIVKNPEEQVSKLKMLTDGEEEKLLKEFNDTESGYRNDKTVTQIFEEQVLKTPEKAAVIFEDQQITYNDLNERANQLANYLRRAGVKQETLVPVYVERSIEMMVSILGILKAGGAYVPFDTEYPLDRIQYMLEDTGATIIVTNKAGRDKLPEYTSLEIIKIDSDWEQISKEEKNNLAINIASLSLAYIIYTSGSTGKPKGVMIEHKSLLNYLLNSKTRYIAEDQESSGSFIHLSYTFDASITAMFMPLLSGKAIVIASGNAMNVFEDPNFKKYAPYDFIKLTPSHLELIASVETGSKEWLTKKLVIGGEALLINHFNYFIENRLDIEIINEYGPTEATVGCSTYSFKPLQDHQSIQGSVPIGHPIDNTQIYIMNESGELVPCGVWGEIAIGGDGLARGYLKQEELTKEKFIKNPFSKEETHRLYKTGDIGKWQEDGTIEYQGRNDDQIKIRGYRIELGEIENILLESSMVKQAVVLAKTNKSGNKYLLGYVVSEEEFNKEPITEWLRTKLPEYMVPSLWKVLDVMPLTINGKIDKKALPEADASELVSNKYIAPVTETEKKLTVIWKQLLGVDRVGINDNFFELGGHSLLAMRMVSAVRRQLDKEMPIRDLFLYPTISTLAAHLQGTNDTLLPSITVQSRPEKIPLSFSQERLWFIDQLEGSVQYHIPAVLRLTGLLDKEVLSKSLQEIVNRHEILRTVYLEDNGKAYQHVQEKGLWKLKEAEGTIYKDDKEGLQQYIQQTIKVPFDLKKDFMLRATLLTLEQDEHLLIVTMHHIASDGWSMPLLVREVAELYSNYSENKPVDLKPLEIQYADYAIWQRNYLQGEIFEKKMRYWSERLEGVSALQLRVDHPRPAIQTTKGSASRFTISKEISDQLHQLSQSEGTTMFMTLLASLNVLLQKYSGQEDICIGTPIANRTQVEVEGLIGFFVNTLALRNEVKGETTFKELLQQVKATTVGAFEHQDLPFEKVVEAVVKDRDLSRTPLFQVMFMLQNTADNPALELKGLELRSEATQAHTAKFELTFSINEALSGLQCSVEYNTNLYIPETIERMIIHFEELLMSIGKNPREKIAKLRMLTEAEENQVLKVFNDTAVDFAKDKNVIDLFEEQVKKSGDSIALVYEQKELSYKELNEWSNRLARYLKSKGVEEEMLVPICIERGFGMIAGILGILKAGGAYVPVDPEYPADRISYMLEDTGAKIILSSKQSRNKLPKAIEIEVIEIESEEIIKESNENLQVNIPPGSLAYVIYTSGSTGKPKGVMIEHRNVYSFISWCQQEFLHDTFEIVYASTSMCFDLSIYEFFYPLSTGKKLRLLENGLEISKYLFVDKAVLINTVPVVIENLLRENIDLRGINVINMAGEPISSYVQKNLDLENISVRNLYGPTEDTTYSTVFRLQKDKNVTIGKPISNTVVQILSKEGVLMPVGVPGEICLGGQGLARGYLNREELTKERFIYHNNRDQSPLRLYKTGDSGCWLPDGSIEYLGRIDNQVKIRGYRIELGEIESVIQESGLVNKAVVLAHSNKEGNKRLIGYIVVKSLFDKEELITYLHTKLPDYMVPVIWVQIEALPLTSNGKIDRKALPDPDISGLLNNEYVAPRNETEQRFSEIWKELLGVDRIGIDDNFFELGGDSILTIQVVSRARRLGYELQPKDIFVHQTINKLCTAIQDRSQGIVLGEQGVLTGASGLLPIQQWYLNSGSPEISHFNQKILLKIDKSVSAKKLDHAIEQITMQHDALRFRYSKTNGVWHQEYGKLKGILIVENITTSDANEQNTIINRLADKYQRSLDIEKGELIKAVLIQTSSAEKDNRLLIVIHHLAVDGVSWRILLEDIELLLGENQTLGNKSTSYRQWYNSLEKFGRSEYLLSQKKYWQNIFKSFAPLPADNSYSALIKIKDNAVYKHQLDADKTSQLLQDVPRVYHTEINDILLCALAATLAEWSNSDKVIIGLEGHGREEITEEVDISRTVGWFTSLYPLLLEIKTKKWGAADLIKSVKEQLRQIPDKGVGYGILKYINKEETLQGEDPWEVIFNYLGQADNIVRKSKYFSGAPESAGAAISDELVVKEKISINSIIRGGNLVITWTYSKKHFNKETIETLSASYISQLETLISHCIEQQKTGGVYTPSDYGLGAEISYEELDQFLNERF